MRNHESSGRRRMAWTIVVSSVVELTFVAMGVVAVVGLSSGREPGLEAPWRCLGSSRDSLRLPTARHYTRLRSRISGPLLLTIFRTHGTSDGHRPNRTYRASLMSFRVRHSPILAFCAAALRAGRTGP